MVSTTRWVRSAASMLVPSGLRIARRDRRLRSQFGLTHLGSDADYVVVDSRFGRRCRINGRVSIVNCTFGDLSYVETGVRMHSTTVGAFTSIAPYAVIGLAEHPTAGYVSTHPAFYLHRPELGYDFVDNTSREEHVRTRIGSDVWIGANACIRTGVTIGHGAVIGAGAVVTADVPAYAVSVGAPARVIRYRFSEEEIAFLLELAWWDRGLTWIARHAATFADISSLRARVTVEEAG